MTYKKFAYLYDHLMSDAPYEKWVQFLLAEKSSFNVTGKRVLDLACGTGEVTVRLAQNGFDVTGVDLSTDMLVVARDKATKQNVDIQLYEQDMSELEGLPTYDIIAIFCDSLNYLQTPEKVRKTFEHVFRHLEVGGLFLFDVHSTYQMTERFQNQTFTWNEEAIAYIWDCFPGKHNYSVEHQLSFFVLDEHGQKYDRIDEWHNQRTYTTDTYIQWLEEAGFNIIRVTADFTNESPRDTSKRIFFTCMK